MVKSYRGKEVDMSALLQKNSKMRTAGNMRVNVRGDLIGKGGKIIKTREQLENEYYKNNPNAVKESVSGFNQGFSEYRDKVLTNELIKEEKTNDPFKKTKKDDPNLSTSSKETVKFTDKVEPVIEDEYDFDSFEIHDEEQSETDNDETKSKRGRKSTKGDN